MSNELTLVRGGHQLGFGANLAYWSVEMWAYSRGNGQFTFNGQNTGLGLADFLLGRPSAFVQGNKVGVAFTPVVPGGVCAGRLARDRPHHRERRSAVGAVLRTTVRSTGSVAHFSRDGFRQGVKSTRS